MSHSILEMFEFKPRTDHRDPCYAKMRETAPLLAAALIGNYDAEAKKGMRGGTLMIYLEDDTLKWTFHHKIAGITLFSSFPELVLSFEDVETAMRERRFDTKKARKSN